MSFRDGDEVRIASLVCLTILATASIICIAYVATRTDRDLTRVEVFTFIIGLAIGIIGGLSFRHRAHWEIKGNGSKQDDNDRSN